MARRRWERTGEWRTVFAPEAPRQALLSILAGLARQSVPEGSETVKRSRLRHVFRIRLVDGSDVFVKHYLHRAARPFGWLGAPSRSLEELSNLERLAAVGVAAVEPLACAERHRRGRLEDAVLMTRALPRARPLAEALTQLPEPDRIAPLGALARSLRRLHDAGFWHRDLHAGNVLVGGEPGDGGLAQPVLVDVQKLRSLRFPLPGALRVRDLAMLGAELGTALPLLEAYLAPDFPQDDAGRLRRRVARAAARRARSRLRSRGRRCVQVSTGFRIERHGRFRVYRRADIEASALLAVLPDSREARVSRAARPR
ncbi:MAG: lipopolysaccharide kinase InaA family protein, partial [Myxococcota bacterium]